ncbi:MAG: DUF2793 domain-containing protein [Pikeienuella sp.]|uniref:DUF2793 domain-containing protein n=1 Tax=Pikeienuella sp. TaxID=2831957 RepID=UPI00391CEB0B
MSDTAKLALPLLSAAQAQKHVTVNEALARLDTITSAHLESAELSAPPPAPAEGDGYAVRTPGVAEWSARDGQVAFFLNGGWNFFSPPAGYAAWVADRAERMIFDGTTWRPTPIGPISSGAATTGALASADEPIVPGFGFSTTLSIPDRAIVLGVTARVMNDMTGPGLTGWRIGVDGAADRYGNAIGLVAGSSLVGVTGAPVSYYSATPLRIEPIGGGAFVGGSIRISVHYLELTPPSFP